MCFFSREICQRTQKFPRSDQNKNPSFLWFYTKTNISKFEIYEFVIFRIGKSVVIVLAKHVNNFEIFEFRNAGLSQDVLLPTTHTKMTYSTVAGVLDLFIVLRSRMSGIGSLGLDSTTLRYSMQGTKYCHRYWRHPRELLYRQPGV